MVDSVAIATKAAKPRRIVWAYEQTDVRTGVVHRYGKLNNLRVKQDTEGRLFIRGSLPKYWRGSNVDTFTYEQLYEAIAQLCKDVGIHPDMTRVFQLDLAATLPMPRPASDYFPALKYRSRFARKPYSHGVSFESDLRTITLYDKGKEAGIEKDNLLRVEVKFKKKLKAQLGRPLFLDQLLDEQIFQTLAFRWKEELDTVEIRDQAMLDVNGTGVTFKNSLIQLGIEHVGGKDSVYQAINASDLSKHQKTNYRRLVRETLKKGNTEKLYSLAGEVDHAATEIIQRILLPSPVSSSNTPLHI